VEPEVLWNEYKNNNLLNNEIPSEEIESHHHFPQLKTHALLEAV
jgi:hypothetical protein